MGVDAKDVGVLLWKILRISTSSVYTCVRKYPLVSGVSAIIFLLYTFLPRVFYFLLFSSPFVAFSAFYLRNHRNVKPLNGLPSPFSQKVSEGGTTTTKAELKHQRSVRRNARRKVEEVGKDWDSAQASEDERDKVILTTLYGEFPQNARKSPKLHKFKKDRAFLVSEEISFEPPSTAGNVSAVDLSEMLTSGGGETEVECSSSSSSEGEQETILEDKKVFAWTEDDQKNLMDLGNSDIERNRRLEHMITRRRTRTLTAERSLMDMEVPPISVGRNNFGLDEENYMIDGLQMPESAPSVLLLPTKNPFDIPYDPQEEKPNLSGDSFHQEIVESDSNTLPSPGVREMESSVSDKAESSGAPGKRNGDHRVGNSLVGLVPRNTVEFSEIGSPPTTAGGNNSSDDEKSPFVCESETGKETGSNAEGNEAKQMSILDKTADSQMLPVEKFDQYLNDAARQFEGLSDGTDVKGRSEEEERSKSRQSLLENPDKALQISEEASKIEEESQDLLQNSVDELKISYVSDEREEPSERRSNQELEEHVRRNDGGESAQETADPEASNVNQVASATSPTSVLPDVSLPLDRTYILASEDLEPTTVIPEPDPPVNQLGGYSSRNNLET
ncbi:unnamed protein product [Microthlaspi erraticum]|uniref:Uncharacterized protein n=1 Tax=Microthlaspi erraticum TaxID=1685480 RepID=A0A6D2IMG9_9BRAS|nr:unnamed protein product [Microthlaspi erraticum]